MLSGFDPFQVARLNASLKIFYDAGIDNILTKNIRLFKYFCELLEDSSD
jgi:kynureninase